MLHTRTVFGTKTVPVAIRAVPAPRRMVAVAVATPAVPPAARTAQPMQSTPARQPAVKASQPQTSSSLQSYHDDIDYILYSEEQLKARVGVMGHQLSVDYADKAPLILGVLTGAFQFTGDLVRAMDPCPRGTTVNFVRASSYGSGTASSGQVTLKVDIDPSRVAGRHVILVEDIVDTGLTLTRLRAYIMEQCGAASCAIVALLDKKERRKVEIVPDYSGFDCPNEFVVGYGLDFDEEYRTLPYIGVLRPECYMHKLS
uniref:Hypoxanthine phosphoribosyltransferase n=1 Tax=Chlamydomonas leiostraca TaxID=1034604 RepID=A0A7S0RF50_9CHLO